MVYRAEDGRGESTETLLVSLQREKRLTYVQPPKQQNNIFLIINCNKHARSRVCERHFDNQFE